MILEMYLHGSKEDGLEEAEKMGMCEKAESLFKYALYEVKLTLDVDVSTGQYKIIKVDDRELAKESVKIDPHHCKEDMMIWVCDKCGKQCKRPYTSVSDIPCNCCEDGTYKFNVAANVY